MPFEYHQALRFTSLGSQITVGITPGLLGPDTLRDMYYELRLLLMPRMRQELIHECKQRFELSIIVGKVVMIFLGGLNVD